MSGRPLSNRIPHPVAFPPKGAPDESYTNIKRAFILGFIRAGCFPIVEQALSCRSQMHNHKEVLMKYKIALHHSDEGYSVSVPGLPGCWSQGQTEAEALANIEVAIREYFSVVEDLLKDTEVREIELAV